MERKGFPHIHWDPNKKIEVKQPLGAVLLSEIIIIKIEAHAERTEPEYQGNVLGKFHATAVATESVKVVAHVYEVHSAPAKNDLLLPDFYHPDVLVTWPTVCS